MIDLTGQTFNRLKVLSFNRKDKDYQSFWNCLCKCGKEVVVSRSHLKSGHTKSCGCLKNEVIDLIGQSFNRLTVTSYVKKDMDSQNHWECTCSCGNIIITRETFLKSGHTKSCGCLQKEIAANTTRGRAKHNHSRRGIQTREYKSWTGMRERCYNKNNHAYPNYGGRGIAIVR